LVFDSCSIAWFMEIGTERLSDTERMGVKVLIDLLTQALPIEKLITSLSSN